MARVPLYAPIEYGGIGYPCLESIQDKKGVTLFLRQLQWDKELAMDQRILLTVAQLESGLTSPILEETALKLPHLEEGLISHPRTLLNVMKGKILIEDQWCPMLQREGDESIMEVVLNLEKIQPGEIKKVNQVRKYLRVITIAELADLDGNHLPTNRFNGRWRANSTLNWANQPPPTAEMWTLFRRV